jgi:hypothetical protein
MSLFYGNISLRLNRGNGFNFDVLETLTRWGMVRRLVAVLVLGIPASGCVYVGVTITNAATIPDCMPG